MNNPELIQFLEQIKLRYPVFMPTIEANARARPVLFAELGGFASRWAASAFGPDILGTMADGYAHFVTDVNREQLAYCRRGNYKNKSYKEVFNNVYDNDAYMHSYHWGVYTTLFLWSHHLELYGFFRDRFVGRCVPEEGRVVDLGCGSGIWSILTAILRPSIRVEGMDISKASLAISSALARAAAVSDRVTFRVADALTLESASPYVAGISAFLMEHLEDPAALLSSFARNLAAGSPLFITAAITAAEVDHIYEFRSEGEVIAMIERAGFRVVEVFSATPKLDERLRFLPRSMAVIAQKKINDNW